MTSQQPIGPVDATRVPRYAGPATFARLPRTDEVTHADVAVVVPEGLSLGATVVTPRSDVQASTDGSHMLLFKGGTSLEDIVRAVNAVGALFTMCTTERTWVTPNRCCAIA